MLCEVTTIHPAVRILAVIVPLSSAHGVEYTFTRIWTVPAPVVSGVIDPPVTSDRGEVFGPPAINDGGVVTFWGSSKEGDASLYIWNGGVPVSIVDTSGEFDMLDARPSINDRGTVAFYANLNNGGSGIFTWSNGVIDTVYDDTGKFSFLFFPDINNTGTVVFRAGLDAGGIGIFKGDGGPTTTIADTGSFDSFRGKAVINDRNVVAFVAERAGDDTGVFLGSGGPLTTVANDSTQVRNVASEVALNNGDVVAFDGARDDIGEFGIYTYQNEIVNKIVDINGPFMGSNYPAINDRGVVAFAANLDSGGEGIFIGPDPVRDKVIEAGDFIDDFTVQSISFGPNRGNHRINNGGQIVFTTRLMAEDGNEYFSIVVATPDKVPPIGNIMPILNILLEGEK